MNPASTRVAPGPNWLRVIASLFQKMLLNSAVGLEKPGDPAGRVAWNSGSFASGPRPAAGGTPMAGVSGGAGRRVVAPGVLVIRAVAGSCGGGWAAAEIGCPVVDDHVVADVDRLGERVGHEDAAAVVTGEVALDQVAVDLHRAGAVAAAGGDRGARARAVGADRQLGLDRDP